MRKAAFSFAEYDRTDIPARRLARKEFIILRGRRQSELLYSFLFWGILTCCFPCFQIRPIKGLEIRKEKDKKGKRGKKEDRKTKTTKKGRRKKKQRHKTRRQTQRERKKREGRRGDMERTSEGQEDARGRRNTTYKPDGGEGSRPELDAVLRWADQRCVYERLLVWAWLLPVCLLTPCAYMTIILMVYAPPHTCAAPASPDALTSQAWRNLTLPRYWWMWRYIHR